MAHDPPSPGRSRCGPEQGRRDPVQQHTAAVIVPSPDGAAPPGCRPGPADRPRRGAAGGQPVRVSVNRVNGTGSGATTPPASAGPAPPGRRRRAGRTPPPTTPPPTPDTAPPAASWASTGSARSPAAQVGVHGQTGVGQQRPACSTASGRSPPRPPPDPRPLGQPGRAAQQRDRLVPGELRHPHPAEPAPGRVPRGDHHLAGADRRQERAARAGPRRCRTPPATGPAAPARPAAAPPPPRTGSCGGQVQRPGQLGQPLRDQRRDPRPAPTTPRRSRRRAGGRTRSPWWSCPPHPSRHRLHHHRTTGTRRPSSASSSSRPVNSDHPGRDRPHPPAPTAPPGRLAAAAPSARAAPPSPTPPGTLTVAVVTPLRPAAAGTPPAGPRTTVPEHRRRALRVLAEQEHQPRHPPSVGGRTPARCRTPPAIAHRRPVPEPGDQHVHIRRRDRLPAHLRRLVVPRGEVRHVRHRVPGLDHRRLRRRHERPPRREPPQLPDV